MNEKKIEFEGTIDSKILRDILLALTAVVDEGVLRFTEKEITLKSVEPANVAMVSLDIKQEIFSEYKLKGKELAVGVDFNKLLNILKVCNDEVVMEMNAEKMHLKSGDLSYDLSLFALDALTKEPKIPDLEYHTNITIGLKDFKRAIKTADTITDYIEFNVSETEISMSANEEDKFTLIIPQEGCAKFDVGDMGKETITSKFSLEYLKSMMNGIIGNSVRLRINKDYPL